MIFLSFYLFVIYLCSPKELLNCILQITNPIHSFSSDLYLIQGDSLGVTLPPFFVSNMFPFKIPCGLVMSASSLFRTSWSSLAGMMSFHNLIYFLLIFARFLFNGLVITFRFIFSLCSHDDVSPPCPELLSHMLLFVFSS